MVRFKPCSDALKYPQRYYKPAPTYKKQMSQCPCSLYELPDKSLQRVFFSGLIYHSAHVHLYGRSLQTGAQGEKWKPGTENEMLSNSVPRSPSWMLSETHCRSTANFVFAFQSCERLVFATLGDCERPLGNPKQKGGKKEEKKPQTNSFSTPEVASD